MVNALTGKAHAVNALTGKAHATTEGTVGLDTKKSGHMIPVYLGWQR